MGPEGRPQEGVPAKDMVTDGACDRSLVPQMVDCNLRGQPARCGVDWRVVWQVTSMSFGIGIFSIPYAFVQIGVMHGAIWIVVLGALTNTALQRLLDLAAASGKNSYEDLAEHAFGYAGKLVSIIITMVAAGTASFAYLKTASDILVGVTVAFILDFDRNSMPYEVEVLNKEKSACLLLVICMVVLPRCLSRSIGQNGWISTGGVFAMCLAAAFFLCSCIYLVATGCNGMECGSNPAALTGSVADTLQYAATLAFSFSMIFAIFPVLQERIVNDDVADAATRMKPAVRMSIAFVCVIYLTVGLASSFTFGTATRPISLENLALSNPLTQVICLLVGVSTALLVAIVSFPCIQSVNRLLGECSRSGTAPSNCWPWIVAGMGMASVVADTYLPTKIAFALPGSLGLSIAAYIMPALLNLKLDDGRGVRGTWNRVGSMLLLFFGIVLLFGSTPVTVVRLLRGGSEGAPKALADLFCHCAAGNGAGAAGQVLV